MRRRYVTVRCSRCNSISQVKTTGVMTDTFLCPVCLDGEIDYQVEPRRVYARESEFMMKDRTLITIRPGKGVVSHEKVIEAISTR